MTQPMALSARKANSANSEKLARTAIVAIVDSVASRPGTARSYQKYSESGLIAQSATQPKS